MSIPFQGTLKRSGGVSAAIVKQLKSLTLKPVNKVSIKFDPFHHKIEETRYFMHYITAPKVQKTNLACKFKTEVVCDRSDPSVTFKLANGDEVIFKSLNLSALEMFKLYNKHITVLAPKETDTAQTIATKSVKKATGIKSQSKAKSKK
ncbi:large ribosomal subunit protein mL53 [Halyomorpha halys]|uniref:large ribosomal subunit protein mL53 n=1 Tax=Halyomorpha halys TaxID=286706 RepID=UPI0006D4E057|nr:39S ribosomal protein L53, mitochondrial [Halyomorpha halys]